MFRNSGLHSPPPPPKENYGSTRFTWMSQLTKKMAIVAEKRQVCRFDETCCAVGVFLAIPQFVDWKRTVV